jgi:hypothetical protein
MNSRFNTLSGINLLTCNGLSVVTTVKLCGSHKLCVVTMIDSLVLISDPITHSRLTGSSMV